MALVGLKVEFDLDVHVPDDLHDTIFYEMREDGTISEGTFKRLCLQTEQTLSPKECQDFSINLDYCYQVSD